VQCVHCTWRSEACRVASSAVWCEVVWKVGDVCVDNGYFFQNSVMSKLYHHQQVTLASKITVQSPSRQTTSLMIPGFVRPKYPR
jgi:hypothetical protein